MGFAILAFIAAFVLIASAGLILFYRETMLERISDVTSSRVRKPRGVRRTLDQAKNSLAAVVERFERVLPRTQAEMSVTQQRLVRAGYRNGSAIKFFYGAKLILPIVLGVTVWGTGLGNLSPFFLYLLALALGYLGPDFYLGRMIKSRQKRINLALPDVLDLLVICVEAGLSLDQALVRTADELREVHPDLSDELEMVVLEQSAGRPRADAWKDLAERTGVESVRNLVTVLAQSEKFGTSIGRTLRTHSDTLRTQRRQKVEEQAAKTTVKLVFPLVFFIFPSIFLVTLGPAALVILESFHTVFSK